MKEDLPHRRRLTTVAGRIAAVLVISAALLAILLAVSCWSVAAPMMGEQAEGRRAEESPDAAVLFLVDDSGGVSGLCRNVQDRDVLVVDESSQRYDTVRFFLELWRAYSWPESWTIGGADPAEVPPLPPNLQVGVMRFAATYVETLPLTSTRSLKDTRLWEDLNKQWGVLTTPRPYTDTRWFCQTNIAETLDAARERLVNSGAPQRRLVLFTDGSLIGSAQEQKDPKKVDAYRVQTGSALKQLHDAEVSVFVVLLGVTRCNENDNSCAQLNEATKNRRKVDLDQWQQWGQEYVTLIDERAAIKLLGSDPEIASLLPEGANIQAGWIENPGNFTRTTSERFPGSAELVGFNLITSTPVDESSFEIEDEIGVQIPLIFDGSHWIRTNHKPENAAEDLCEPHAWQARSKSPLVGYYWFVYKSALPELESFTVFPSRVVMNRDSLVTITASIKKDSYPQLFPCYAVQIQAPEMELRLSLGERNQSIKASFSLPDTLPWQDATITATLVYTGEASIPVGTEAMTEDLAVRWEPQVQEAAVRLELSEGCWKDMAALKPMGAPVTVSVPIAFSGKVPGFAPYFQPVVEPTTANLSAATKTATKAGCFDGEPFPATPSPADDAGMITYTVPLPYMGLLDEDCGFHYLRIGATDPEHMPRPAQIDLLQLTPVPRLTATPTFSPIPSPTKETGGGGDIPKPETWNHIWGILGPILVMGLLAVVVFMFKPWKKTT